MVLIISHNANDDKSTVAFTIANAALSTGTDVAIFLTSDGVELSRDGATDYSHVKPFKALNELIESFVENGGFLWSCAPCFEHRGLRTEETVAKTMVTGAGPMLEWIREGARVISL
ncbi:MAG: DsrE family protein [Myxococcota bacterium]